MTITLNNDNDVIVYGLEKILSFCKVRQLLFAAHCVWWLAGLIGLESGLIVHINELWLNSDLNREELGNDHMSDDITSSDNEQDSVLKDCERVLQ